MCLLGKSQFPRDKKMDDDFQFTQLFRELSEKVYAVFNMHLPISTHIKSLKSQIFYKSSFWGYTTISFPYHFWN